MEGLISSDTIEKQTSPEKGVMENIHQGTSDTISSEGAIKEIHQENEIKSEEILADLELPGKMQSEVVSSIIIDYIYFLMSSSL